jgi:hypothetical protein
MGGKRKGSRKPKETALEREWRLRKKAEQRLGRAMAELVWAHMRAYRVRRRPLEAPDLARRWADRPENR